MSGRVRWKAQFEVPLTREEVWFLKALCDHSLRGLPGDGPGQPARMLIEAVERKLSRALEPRR